jgi:hypothetical protein
MTVNGIKVQATRPKHADREMDRNIKEGCR